MASKQQYKKKYLIDCLIAYDRWERGGSWDDVLTARWHYNLVDELEDDFFLEKEELEQKERRELEKKTREELEYQQSLPKQKGFASEEDRKIWTSICVEASNERIKGYERKLKKFVDMSDDPDIARAREYPIDELMEFRRGFALCPFHNEKTASFKYYPKTNSCYCFGCGKHADAIDVAMQVWQCPFPEAVAKLSTR